MFFALIKVFWILIAVIECLFCYEMDSSDTNCNVTYTRSDLIISYLNNESVNCINNIIAPDDHRIVVTILQLDIPQQINGHSNCKNHLSFSPVTPTESRVLKLCGQTGNDTTGVLSQKQIISFNSSLTFQFYIDYNLRLVLILSYYNN